ncbi:single-strand DNA endonuclease ASTE1-like [Haliotis cracherodii]|uniref:single-strand DNA endonuclease ASTE1-like n=1 Tax=Haliotis cracherodii TaxID=6455 RepID=UPI0039E897F0
MGIRGFTSFVDSNNNRLLQDHNLHCTRVVIDGNNFYHFLYQYLHVKHHYGGDYDVFYKKVKEIFQMFEECDIKPFIVFDGGYEADGKKLKTTLTRAKNRIHLAGFISHGGRGRILPILAYETFKTVLVDMGVPYIVCDFEADSQIVKLANHWHCPVMSNDSDFFVFDLRGGFILFDYVDFRLASPEDPQTGKTYHCLSVQLYHIDHFAKEFPGFDKTLLPVIAVLLGNDFIESSLFENFFHTLKSAWSKSLPQRHQRLAAILSWCEDYRSWEDAVEKILTYVPKESRDNLRLLIHRCIRFYIDLEESFSLSDFFDSDSNTALQQRTDEIKSYNGSLSPSWFISAHRSGAIHPFFLNTVVLHRNVLLTQVENMKVASSYSTSERIRQVMYGILLKDDSCTPIDNLSGRSQDTHVLEYTRDESKNLKKTLLESINSLPNFGQLPGLSQLGNISTGQRVDMILEVLSVPNTFLELWSPPLQLLACVIVYWILQSQPRVTRYHYHALLVCIILLQSKTRIRQLKQNSRHYKHEQETDEVSKDDILSSTSNEGLSDPKMQSKQSCQKADPISQICVQSACEKATESQLTQFLQKVDKHHAKFAPVTKCSPVESAITHGSSQFQACLLDCLHLNQLLQSPLEHPRPHTFFSGVFLYNFTKELRSRSKPLSYISDILGPKSPMSAVFTQMESLISKHIGEDCFQETGTGKKNSKKKGKKKGDRKKTDYAKSDVCSENSDNDLPEMVQAACELDNRFSCLLLDV